MSDHHVVCGKCGIGVNFVCDNCGQEEPCPWCHGLRSNFRSGDMGYGEEDFDSASSCPSSTQRHPCEERVRRVNAEFERDTALARAEASQAPRYCARCGLVWSPVRRGGIGSELQADCPGCELRAALARAEKAENSLLAVRSLHAEDGRADMRMSGEGIALLARTIIDFYRQHGAENNVEVTATDTETGEQFVLTVQRVGGKTPGELRLAAEAEAKRLRSALEAIPCQKFTVTVCRATDLARHDWCTRCAALSRPAGGEEADRG